MEENQISGSESYPSVQIEPYNIYKNYIEGEFQYPWANFENYAATRKINPKQRIKNRKKNKTARKQRKINRK